jgi:hypothetical protein
MDSKTPFPLTGSLLVFIGAAHTVLGIVIWVAKDQDPELSFWFTAFGIAAITLGLAIAEVERSHGYVTAPVLAATAALTAFGLAFQPVSGFLTILLPLAIGTHGWSSRRNLSPTAA